MKGDAQYFAVAFLHHDVILGECLDSTDECQSREPWAYSGDGNLRRLCEYRDLPLKRSICLRDV
jgi:hypothetical protein